MLICQVNSLDKFEKKCIHTDKLLCWNVAILLNLYIIPPSKWSFINNARPYKVPEQ